MTQVMQYDPVSDKKDTLTCKVASRSTRTATNLMTTLICVWFTLFTVDVPAEDNSLNEPFTVEYYYSVKYGYLNEWMELYKRNHWPVMMAEMNLGHVLDIKIDRQRTLPPESHRWYVRINIPFANVQTAHNIVARGKEERMAKLFADRDLFEREEQRRFELLDGLRSIEVVPVTTDKW